MDLLGILADVALICVVTVVVMLLLGVGARRLLGVRMSVGRIIFAGIIGLGAGVGFESQFVWRTDAYTPAVIPILLGIIFFVAVAVLVVAELIVPQGTIPRPDQWLPGIRRGVDRNRRYVELARIAARHRLVPFRIDTAHTSAGSAARRLQAEALKAALQDAGGAFIKLGQLLSTRPDILPAEFTDALSTLQQRVPPAPWGEVEPALASALGAPPHEVFAEFDEQPFAAASIGQVYAATLHSGERVAVKVRRPGIVPLVERDVDIAVRISRQWSRSSEWAQQMGVEDLVRSLTESLSDELDYSVEAMNVAGLLDAQNQVAEDARVLIPQYFPALSTRDVLVMEYIDGATLSDPAATAALTPDARRELARRLFTATLSQIMEAGVFHSDLHPGNVVITASGQLALLDFGSVGRLDSQVRSQIADVLLAFSRRDATAFADALIAFVEIPDNLDEAGLRRRIGAFMAQRLGVGAQLDATVFSEIVAILSEYGLTVPAELTVPFRAIATVEGSLRALSPEFDLVTEAGSFAQQRVADAGRPASIAKAVSEELLDVLPIVKRLPHRIDRITGNLADGRLNVNVRILADKRDRGFIREIINLAALTFLAGIFGIMAAILLASGAGPVLTPTLTLFQMFGYLFLVVSGVLTLRALFDTLRRH